MSYTSIMALWPGTDKPAEEIAELSNAHGTATIVWEELAHFIPAELLDPRPLYSFWMTDMERAGQAFWDLWKKPSVPLLHRTALALTFDRWYVEQRDYARLADDLDAFFAPLTIRPGVNHWPTIIELLRSGPDYPALGFSWTSVAENFWHGEWDDDAEQHLPIDWTACLSLYRMMDAQTEDQ